eukprot:TRINITY_DN1519_c0_g2_i5.p1 TRINITY_DN1519_c0_g2~~TRINITY_DN1519_c0_g2_i5.p1  ORF type:complete len:398 (+),score=122.40 TRINITY_DN1519_c0_g2_i5:48-1196(+)
MTETSSRTHPEEMLSIYRFALPKTRCVNFEQKIQTSHQETQATLKKISNQREELRAFLDQETATGSQTAIEKFIPLFSALAESIKNLPQDLSKATKFPWTTAVGKRCSAGPYESTSPYWELISLYTALGISFRNRAAEHSKGLYSASNAEDLAEKLKFISGLLTKASGVFEYTGNLLGSWTDRPTQDIPEMNLNCFTALSELSLAEAQEVTVIKGLSGGTSMRALSKLCLGIQSKMARVGELLKSSKLWDETSPDFCNYVNVKSVFWRSIHHKLLAEQESQEGNHGIAIAQAAESLRILNNESKTIQLGGLSTIWNKQHKEIQSILQQFEADNEKVYFEHVPDATTVRGGEPAYLTKSVPFVPAPVSPINVRIEGSTNCCIQ